MNCKAALTALGCAGALLGQPAFAAQRLEVEPNHTSIGFSIPIAGGLTRATGKFTEFEIVLHYDGDDVLADVGSWTLDATIVTASVDTGIDARDRHLRTADFFDAEAYPEIRFTSRRIEGSGSNYVAFGELSMHGVTRPLELSFTLTGRTPNQVTGGFMIGAAARAKVLRSDYAIANDFKHTHIENFLGDEVEIEIFCWLGPPKKSEESAASAEAPNGDN